MALATERRLTNVDARSRPQGLAEVAQNCPNLQQRIVRCPKLAKIAPEVAKAAPKLAEIAPE